MYIRRVRIENIRGFREVELDFTRPDGSLAGWTVLAGRNGSGKSTLLKAMGLAVSGATTARVLQETFSGWIRSSSKSGNVTLTTALTEKDSFTLDSSGEKELPPEMLARPSQGLFFGLYWIVGNDREPSLLPTLQLPKDLQIVQGFNLNQVPNAYTGPWSESAPGWFMAGYGPYRRLTGHATEVQRLMAGPDRIARLISLFREESSLVESVQWLRELYLQRLEKRRGAGKLEKAVFALLNDGLLPDGVVIERVDSSALWVRQHKVRIPLTELSDGYRTTAALVMDIIRQLRQSFGELQVEQAEDEEGPYLRVLHEGVVLIDEVDLHLHISWQKRIGFWLKRHFPNIQFIVTTHSPFVCQAADPKGLIRLPAPGEGRSAEHVSEELYNTVVNGSLDEAVLTELFGLETPYSEPAEKLRERVAHLEARLQTGKATKAEKREYQELSARLPQTPVTAVEQALRKLAADA